MRPGIIRFSLRTFLLLVPLLAVLFAYSVVPTYRARQFAAHVNAGDTNAAENMLPDSLDIKGSYRQALRSAKVATLTPLDVTQLIRGQRGVIVGKGWGGGEVEFLLSPRSASLGRSWLHVW